MKPLSNRELNTLLAMAKSAQTVADAIDCLSAFGLLEPAHKGQLRESLKGLPVDAKRLLKQAAILRKAETREVAV